MISNKQQPAREQRQFDRPGCWSEAMLAIGLGILWLLAGCGREANYPRIVKNKCRDKWAVETHPGEFYLEDQGTYWVHIKPPHEGQYPDSLSAAKSYRVYYDETIKDQAESVIMDSIYHCQHTYQ
jgi:hypothetical protein